MGIILGLRIMIKYFNQKMMKTGRIIHFICILVACLLAASCNDSSESNQPIETSRTTSSESETIPRTGEPGNTPTTISEENNPVSKTTPDRFELTTITVMPELVNPQDLQNSTPIVGEVPEEILDRIISDLIQRTGADEQNIQVIRSEAVIWNDGSLGCPKPGDFYTQEPVDGYWVVLQMDGVDYDYRVSVSGYFTLCEGRGGVPISPPDENPPKQ
jgi:hypothetical protein